MVCHSRTAPVQPEESLCIFLRKSSLFRRFSPQKVDFLDSSKNFDFCSCILLNLCYGVFIPAVEMVECFVSNAEVVCVTGLPARTLTQFVPFFCLPGRRFKSCLCLFAPLPQALVLRPSARNPAAKAALLECDGDSSGDGPPRHGNSVDLLIAGVAEVVEAQIRAPAAGISGQGGIPHRIG